MPTDKASSQVEDIDYAGGRRVTLALPISIIENKQTGVWGVYWVWEGKEYGWVLEGATSQASAWALYRAWVMERLAEPVREVVS